MGKIADTMRSWPMAEQQRRQVIAFDRELEEATTERDALKAQNQKLKLKVDPLEREVERLKEQVKSASAQPEVHIEKPRLEEVREYFLFGIGKVPNITTEELAAAAKMDEELAKFHLVYTSPLALRHSPIQQSEKAEERAVLVTGTEGRYCEI